jgi:PHD/YefM family antitoxin component YafN of YafNO toxin-antitoxin module
MTIEELLQIADGEVIIISQHGKRKCIVAPVDEFDLEVEVESLRDNKEFMDYLDDISASEHKQIHERLSKLHRQPGETAPGNQDEIPCCRNPEIVGRQPGGSGWLQAGRKGNR